MKDVYMQSLQQVIKMRKLCTVIKKLLRCFMQLFMMFKHVVK